jgi:hypothetical protein
MTHASRSILTRSPCVSAGLRFASTSLRLRPEPRCVLFTSNLSPLCFHGFTNCFPRNHLSGLPGRNFSGSVSSVPLWPIQSLTPLESALTKTAPVTPLESALTKSASASPLESALTQTPGGLSTLRALCLLYFLSFLYFPFSNAKILSTPL